MLKWLRKAQKLTPSFAVFLEMASRPKSHPKAFGTPKSLPKPVRALLQLRHKIESIEEEKLAHRSIENRLSPFWSQTQWCLRFLWGLACSIANPFLPQKKAEKTEYRSALLTKKIDSSKKIVARSQKKCKCTFFVFKNHLFWLPSSEKSCTKKNIVLKNYSTNVCGTRRDLARTNSLFSQKD